MRIFFFPITAKRSLVYCQKLDTPLVRAKPRLDDRLATRVGRMWDRFQKSDARWKQFVVVWVDKLLDTVPFEESGLKAVPPPNNHMRQLQDRSHIPEKEAIRTGKKHELLPVKLIYPATAYSGELSFSTVQAKLSSFAENALKTHRKQMAWCLLGLPLTLPLSVNPLLPNIPGMYLTYRLWSNYRAYKSAQNLLYLVSNKQLRGETLPALDEAYKQYPVPMTTPLAERLSDIFDDQTLDREIQQSIRQTSASAPIKVSETQKH